MFLYLTLTLWSFSVEKMPYFMSPWLPGPNPKSVLLISLWNMERSLLYARILLIIWLRKGRGAYFSSSSISCSFKERKCVYFLKHQIYSYQQNSPSNEGIHMFVCDWARGIKPKFSSRLSSPFCLMLSSPDFQIHSASRTKKNCQD